MKTIRLALFLFAAALASSCTDSATSPSQSPPFQKIDLSLGNGAVAASGNTLTVSYTGWLYDPTKPDDKGLPFD